MLNTSTEKLSRALFLEGSLKQQSFDENGLFTWIAKSFQLDVRKQSFKLSNNQTVANNSTSSDNAYEISLKGIKQAKEWSFNSAIAGYGFDLIWTSGKIWSFLIDTEEKCYELVNAINNSIEVDDKDNISFSQPFNVNDTVFSISDHEAPIESSNIRSKPQIDERDENKTFTPQYHMDHKSTYQPNQPTDERSFMKTHSNEPNHTSGRGNLHEVSYIDEKIKVAHAIMQENSTLDQKNSYKSSNVNTKVNSSIDPNNSMTNPHPNIYPYPIDQLGSQINSNINYTPNTKPPSIHSNQNLSASFLGLNMSTIPQSNSLQNIHATLSSNETSPDNIKSSDDESAKSTSAPSGIAPESSGRTFGGIDLSTNARPPSYNLSSASMKHDESSRQSNQPLDTNPYMRDAHYPKLRTTIEESQLDDWKRRYKDLAMKSDNDQHEIFTLRREIEMIRDHHERTQQELSSTKQTLKDAKRREYESQSRHQLLMAEENSFKSADRRSLIEQYRRDINNLREELQAERERFTLLLEEERMSRNQSEENAVQSYSLHSKAQDEVDRLSEENLSLNKQIEELKKIREKEHEVWKRQHREEVQALENKLHQAEFEHQTQLKLKIAELTEKYQYSLREIETQVRETTKIEMQGQRLREIAEIQQSSSKDIEKIRLGERQSAAIQIEKVKVEYEQRERQTSEDLAQLESLHNTRVQKLEQQLHRANETIASLQSSLSQLRGTQTNHEHVKREMDETHRRTLEQHQYQAEALARQLNLAHREVQEARLREANYRDRLKETIEELRLTKAELIEVKDQRTKGSAEADTWRSVVHDQDLSTSGTLTKLQIAYDEIQMLEHEMNRIKNQNVELNKALIRADKIIYGRASTLAHLDPNHPIVDDTVAKIRYGSENDHHNILRASKRSSSIESNRSAQQIKTNAKVYNLRSASPTRSRKIPDTERCHRSPTRCGASAIRATR